jgi:hypothetical protein
MFLYFMKSLCEILESTELYSFKKFGLECGSSSRKPEFKPQYRKEGRREGRRGAEGKAGEGKGGRSFLGK